MLSKIHQHLSSVRRRLRLVRMVQWSVRGWTAGGLVAIVAALLWRADVGGVSGWSPLLLIAMGVVMAAALGWIAPLRWHQAAAEVDRHYGLKDRSLTALEFSQDDRGNPLRQLQVDDAAAHLSTVNARQVVPWRRPRGLVVSLAASMAVAGIMLAPNRQRPLAAVPAEVRQVVLEQAEYLDETMLSELERLADDDHPEISELVRELEKLVDELRDPQVDQREALAKLSLMQQQVSESLSAFNLEQTDAALRSVAASIDGASSMQPIASDLRDEKYEQAAEKLEAFDPEALSNKERRMVASNLKKLSEELAEGKLGEFSESTAELSEGLEKKSESQCKGGACKLASLARTQSLRKSVCDCLSSQLNRLAQCKSQCNKNGCSSDSKSDSPSNSWGRGSTDPLGDQRTELDSQRERIDVTGQQGDGASEREIVTTPEARQLASRSYKQQYRQYRKQAEEVLDSEPLPLGYRETVRNYFEQIRPTDDVE